jgi:outer membrane protein, multidrug efflux system
MTRSCPDRGSSRRDAVLGGCPSSRTHGGGNESTTPLCPPRGRAVAVLVTALTLALAQPALAEPEGKESLPPGLTPDVSDPMLSPPPTAPRQIGSWDEALAVIRAQSPDYVTSYESVVRAEAQKRIVLAAVLPILNGQGSYTHQFFTEEIAFPTMPPFGFVSPSPDVLTVGVSVNWAILNPRGLYEVGTAEKKIAAAKLSFSDQRRVIAMSVVHTMLATLAAQRVADLNRVGLRSALQRLALTQARLQFGQGTALDVDRAQDDTEAARRLIISGDEALLQTREVLGAALSSPVAVSPPGDLDLEHFEASVARTCRLNDDIEKRPDVRAARVRLEIAERDVRDAELLFAPSVNVASQFAHSNVAVLGPLTTWDVQGVLNVPLYDGGARYGAMRDARAAVEQARQALVSTRLSAIVGSEQALREVGVYRASRDVAKVQRDLSARIDARTRDGYAHGLGTSLDLVTSAQDLRRAEIDLALLEFQLAEARADAVLTNAECLY